MKSSETSTSHSWSILSMNLRDAEITLTPEVVEQNGNLPVGPNVVVKVGNKILKEGTDYTLSNDSARTPGNYNLVVNGIGNYSGQATAPWSVVKPVEPTPVPTAEPTATPEPTAEPTVEPTVEPTTEPEPTAPPEPTYDDVTLSINDDGKGAKASGDIRGLYARVAISLEKTDGSGETGLYITQGFIDKQGNITWPTFAMRGMRVTAVNVALVRTLTDITSPTPRPVIFASRYF